MRKLIKGLTAYLVTFSMCALIFGIPAMADNEDGSSEATPPTETSTETSSATVRKLYVDFMGIGETPLEEASSKSPPYLTADNVDSDNEFWIAVSADNVNDLPLFTEGIYSFEMAFEYNPQYIKPYTTTNNPDDDWQKELEKGNFTDSGWDKNKYDIISVRSTDIDIVNDREDKDGAVSRMEAGWEMCTVCVTFKKGETFENPRFKDLNSADKQYLIKIPFKLVSVPAESEEDRNPTVLKLVLGPETLDIGAGENGVTPYSAWEATITENNNNPTNMKTLFGFGGDIKLFGKTASITNIIPVKPMSGEETEDTPYTLSRSKQLNKEAFDSATDKYYLEVPNETAQLKLNIETSEAPGSVTVNGDRKNSSLDGSNYVTEVFDLVELNRDVGSGGEADGFNNTVVVESRGSTYTIYIRRLLKPKIILNPGNSPYGEIERMAYDDKDPWDKDKITKAKEEFNKTHKYAVGYTPTGLEDKSSITYRAEAWIGPYNQIVDSILPASEEDAAKIANPEINMDRNETAIFAYHNKTFADTGFTAINSLGEDVTDQVIRSIQIQRIKKYDIDYIPTQDDTDTFTFTKDDGYDLSKIAAEKGSSGSADVVRPNIYDLDYTFTDIDGKTIVKNTRKIIVLPELGNVNMKDNVDTNDTIAIYAHDKKNKMIASVEDIKNLFIYRVADTNMKDSVDTNDTIAIYAHDKKNKMIINHYQLTH